MRWISFLLLLVISVDARAGEVFLIPEDNPKPVYPRYLQRIGVTGDVRISFYVNADGSVDRVKVLESDNPDMSEAAMVAIEKWRFKPWMPGGELPTEQQVIASLAFRLELDSPIHTNQWIKQLKCREVNEALRDTPEYAWVDSPPFHYTRAYLSNTFHVTQLPDEQRLAWIALLNRKVPTIVRQCRSSPVIKFMNLLPTDIRNLL
ncbi:energy transducer TonB [Pseudomonas violetae]|jgi:periplasmic protein TonB|uniref:Protein TonB n=1 Tax=Pseudomonas violetae TaxID=2915813 RepID=A0ABT0EWR8_9PSED|nr:energy transducer TonB [Pseudomonas violetae]MCK1790186.1 energy transducer TonB [Pseudomonas violetae]